MYGVHCIASSCKNRSLGKSLSYISVFEINVAFTEPWLKGGSVRNPFRPGLYEALLHIIRLGLFYSVFSLFLCCTIFIHDKI